MDDNQVIAAISLAGFLVLVSAGLARRRLSGATWLRLAVIWAAIFTGVAVAASLIERSLH